jgi:hypothetical protein
LFVQNANGSENAIVKCAIFQENVAKISKNLQNMRADSRKIQSYSLVGSMGIVNSVWNRQTQHWWYIFGRSSSMKTISFVSLSPILACVIAGALAAAVFIKQHNKNPLAIWAGMAAVLILGMSIAKAF